MTTAVEKTQLTHLRLFIVGHSSKDRSLYIQWIEHTIPAPMSIQEITTGEEALLACKLMFPHGILLDNELPDMTGLDFLKKTRQACLPSLIPPIFIIGNADEDIAAQAIQLGAHDYFIKNTLSEEFLCRHIKHAVNHVTTSGHIQALERQSKTIFQSSGDGLVVVGADARILFANPAAEHIFQLTNEDLVGTPFGYPLIQGETKEITIRCSDTQAIPVELRVTLIEWEQTPAYLTSLRDLTERRKAEEERKRHEIERQYAQKQESLGVLAGGIAHDFNNLLMSIVARAGLALRSLPPDSPAHEHLQIIEKSGLRGGELANQMLTFAGQTQLDFQTINLQQFFKEIKSFLRSTVSKRITLTFNISTTLPSIRGDRSQLRQLLMNVVTNAAEAIGVREGTIQLSTAAIDTSTYNLSHYHIMGDLPWGTCVAFQIQDSGDGMDPELIPKIFDPFFSTKLPGRGLGLAALLGIVRGHGAAIAVHSHAGQGTEFLFLFPTTQKPSPQMIPSLTLPNNALDKIIPSKILVVDDEEEVRTACSLILKEMGFDALVARDGQAGDHVFERHHDEIALVFLDLTMPHIDGGKLAEKIRARDPDIPILVSSGYSEEEAMKYFMQSGINAFIQKPFQVEMFIAKIQELIGMNIESEK